MQARARLERVIEGLGCSDFDLAGTILAYEELLTETLHMCEAHENGMPYYTQALEVTARILSRDSVCDVVDAIQGNAEGSRLRRMLRGGDYIGATMLVLRGHVAQLRVSVPNESVVSVVDAIAQYLFEVTSIAGASLNNETPTIAERRAALLTGMEAILETVRASAQQSVTCQQQSSTSLRKRQRRS